MIWKKGDSATSFILVPFDVIAVPITIRVGCPLFPLPSLDRMRPFASASMIAASLCSFRERAASTVARGTRVIRSLRKRERKRRKSEKEKERERGSHSKSSYAVPRAQEKKEKEKKKDDSFPHLCGRFTLLRGPLLWITR